MNIIKAKMFRAIVTKPPHFEICVYAPATSNVSLLVPTLADGAVSFSSVSCIGLVGLDGDLRSISG